MPKTILETLGFRRNWVYETIVASHPKKGLASAAPMGVWTGDLRRVKLKIYNGSKTLANITASGAFTVNFPKDVRLFHRALASKRLPLIKTPSGLHAVKDHSRLELQANDMKKAGNAVIVTAEITGHRILKNTRLFNRAEALTLEYLISKTKPNVKANELAEYRRAIRKVAPKSEYAMIVER
ncbi:MAG: DUF447 family protein [Candidatus Altiarchaeota archaeon]|nr:DUF447 family protein [Candidatus Altiarchaeota archaeon]